MLAIVAPGQGAQVPGFLTPWLALPGVEERLAWLSAVARVDLVRAGTVATAEEVRDTAVAQPLLVAAGLVAAAELGTDVGRPGPDLGHVGAVAGHSVGALTVAAVAGALSAEAALSLVRERGLAMAAAAGQAATGMTAVLGGEPDEVAAALEAHGLYAANRNGAGQVVAAGPLAALDRLAAAPPARARVRPLPVAGAFHTPFMAPARERLAAVVAGLDVRDPVVPVVSDVDGAVVCSGAQLRTRVVEQVTSSVRWDRCMQTLAELGVTAVIELLPGGTLTGLLRRALPEVQTVAVRTPDDLPAARRLLAAHSHLPTEAAPPWRVVVAPVSGVFRPQATEPGALLAVGSPLGTVASNSRETPVAVSHPGVLVEWLAHDGDPVAPGQPLARLHPELGA